MRRLSAYRVFLTQRNEYHVRGLVCCAVRSRSTGQFHSDHWALRRPLASAFPDARGYMCSLTLPAVGEPLSFDVDGELLETSPVLSIEERDHVYLSRANAALLAAVAANGGSARDSY